MTSRLLIAILLLAAPLAAQHIAASNQSDKTPLNPLAVWEEAVAVIREAEGLHDALSSGEYDFDISADACLSIRRQQRSGRTPALPAPIKVLGSATAECEVLLTEEYVKEALHGWQYDFPTPTGSEFDVCASGCDYTTLQLALAPGAVPCNSIITVTAGETVNLNSSTITLNNHCSEDAPLWIRTSAHASLPPLHERVTIADASNMPKWTGGNSNAEIIETDVALIAISTVNTGTDTLTMASAHGLSVGDQVFFTTGSTQPLSDVRPYWVLTVPSNTTLTVSKFENAGAATLDITGTASGSLLRPAAWVRLTGLYLEANLGANSSGALFDEINTPYHPDARTHHIWIDRSIIRGNPNDSSVTRCVRNASQEFAVTDSLIEYCGRAGQEGQAIWNSANADGPSWIENNKLIGAGEHIMTGGALGANTHINPCRRGDCVTKGNHFDLPAQYYKRTVQALTPTTPCVPGEKWNNSGTYSVCDAGGASWSASTVGDFPLDFAYKNHYEIKKGNGFLNTGNLYENAWYDAQDGTIINVKSAGGSQNGPMTSTKNVLFYGELIRKAAGVIQFAGTAPDFENGVMMDNLAAWNVLAHNIDQDLYDGDEDGNHTPAADKNVTRLQATNLQGLSLRHITFVHTGDTTRAEYGASTNNTPPPRHQPDPLSIHDSVWAFDNVAASGEGDGCNSFTATPITLDIGANVWFWTDGAGPDLTACVGAYYGETSQNSIGYASWSGGMTPDDFRITSAGATRDYRAGGAADASDGKDQGADIDIVKDLTGGAEAGLLSWSEQFGVAITAVGSTTATVEWDRPNAANACNLTLYTDYARTAEHGDTNISGEKADNRAGNDVTAGHVTFNLGANDALTTKTWYWFEIDCPTDSVRMVGSLFTN